MLSGVIPQDTETLKLFKVPVITPSLHMYSKNDNIVKTSKHLALRKNILLTHVLYRV
jgi:hypothetical protein